jgi:hypothetical protein
MQVEIRDINAAGHELTLGDDLRIKMRLEREMVGKTPLEYDNKYLEYAWQARYEYADRQLSAAEKARGGKDSYTTITGDTSPCTLKKKQIGRIFKDAEGPAKALDDIFLRAFGIDKIVDNLNKIIGDNIIKEAEQQKK